MIDDYFGKEMATERAHDVCREMRRVMKDKRLATVDENTGKPISLRALCARTQMDVAILSRAENLEIDTVPALSFWLDWTESLNLDLGAVVKEAKNRLKKSGE